MDTLEEAKKALTALTRKTSGSEKKKSAEIILKLKKEITAARASGKTWKEIQEVLAGTGVKTTIPALSKKFSFKKEKEKVQKKEVSNEVKNPVIQKPVVQKPAGQQKGISEDGSFEMPKDRKIF